MERVGEALLITACQSAVDDLMDTSLGAEPLQRAGQCGRRLPGQSPQQQNLVAGRWLVALTISEPMMVP